MRSDMDERLTDFMRRTEDDIKEIKSDIKELLGFKWQIIGGSVVVSVVVGLAVQYLLNIKG